MDVIVTTSTLQMLQRIEAIVDRLADPIERICRQFVEQLEVDETDVEHELSEIGAALLDLASYQHARGGQVALPLDAAQ